MERNAQGPHQDLNSINISMIIQTLYKMKIDMWLIDFFVVLLISRFFTHSLIPGVRGNEQQRLFTVPMPSVTKDHGHKTTVLKSHPKEHDFFSY